MGDAARGSPVRLTSGLESNTKFNRPSTRRCLRVEYACCHSFSFVVVIPRIILAHVKLGRSILRRRHGGEMGRFSRGSSYAVLAFTDDKLAEPRRHIVGLYLQPFGLGYLGDPFRLGGGVVEDVGAVGVFDGLPQQP